MRIIIFISSTVWGTVWGEEGGGAGFNFNTDLPKNKLANI
jgi:hypothetical protein